MEHYAGIDVSLERSSVCVVDATGRIVREAKVPSEPEPLVRFFRELGVPLTRVGLEAGPLSRWLHAGLTALIGHGIVGVRGRGLWAGVDIDPELGRGDHGERRESDRREDQSPDESAHHLVRLRGRRGGADQRDALARLGVDGTRPPLDLADADPHAYLAALSRASEAAELRARGGWGDFWWVVTDTRVRD